MKSINPKKNEVWVLPVKDLGNEVSEIYLIITGVKKKCCGVIFSHTQTKLRRKKSDTLLKTGIDHTGSLDLVAMTPVPMVLKKTVFRQADHVFTLKDRGVERLLESSSEYEFNGKDNYVVGGTEEKYAELIGMIMEYLSEYQILDLPSKVEQKILL